MVMQIEQLIESQLREFTRLGKDGKFYIAADDAKSSCDVGNFC
jgi:hypothetical protein